MFDRGYPSFGIVDSAISIDVVGMKSYMDSLFDPTCFCFSLLASYLLFPYWIDLPERIFSRDFDRSISFQL